MRSRSFKARNPNGQHRLHFTEWGTDGAPVVLCLHGLTQTARSFDALAASLSARFQVISLDIVGRGESDWLPDPRGYGFPQYVADVYALLAHLEVADVDIVGTSMGGIIGMTLAAQSPTPVRRLVVNDVGPFIPKFALARIRDYVGTDPAFPDMTAFEAYLRMIWAPFDELSDAQWRHLAETSARTTDTDMIAPAYDPDIRVPILAAPVQDADFWAVWDAIDASSLVIRRGKSDLLLAETAEEMTRRGPKAEFVEFAGIGHAPALMAEDQIRIVNEFLTS